MKLYERIENNNFDEIDRNRAIELIEDGNGHLVYNENYFKLQKENEKLKNKLLDTLEGQKVIKEETPQYIKENYIPIQKIKDRISERQFELQQEYKDFEDDAILIVLQELIEGRSHE
jgi:hypothetical protein|nr:MAG TPA: hypothetical protein [Caudoviricetes sp.]